MRQFIAFAPQLLGAVLLLIAGWIVANGLRIATQKIMKGFDLLVQRAVQRSGAPQGKQKRSYAVVAGKFVFWMVMLFFITATANMLGWEMFSDWMNSIVNYLPNLITGLLIILGGFLLGNGARSGVISAANSAGLEQGELLSRVAQIVILFTTLVIGVEQIGINVHFLTNVLVVIVGVLLAGGALAFSFGAKSLVANIIGAQYIRKYCHAGEHMIIGNVDGSVVEVTQTSIILDTESGRTIIPAKHFQDQVTHFIHRTTGDIKNETSAKKGG